MEGLSHADPARRALHRTRDNNVTLCLMQSQTELLFVGKERKKSGTLRKANQFKELHKIRGKRGRSGINLFTLGRGGVTKINPNRPEMNISGFTSRNWDIIKYRYCDIWVA